MRFLDRLGRRPMVIVAGWVLAAVLAVLVGVVGIGLVGAGLTSRQGAPISEEDVKRALGTTSASPAIPSSAAPSEQAGQSPQTAQAVKTPGGTVMVTCERIESMAPAQGWSVHEQNAREGEFRGNRDNHDRVKVELSCAGGQPQLRVREES
ncbi:hypothetical protein BJ973_006633 [Actinoplanes tereljensis]|uniref:Uncharacterized protein n=1 Tax=Paractinoplanes tereljensis TaxID=571912 RepID=A0A919NL08_9ACTN|nr:hypothetical protein [Actinoplanes tereljensis]GIF19587.1 hypothetical protein Ate02nite_23170 [Actinoplanes tereljensis]